MRVERKPSVAEALALIRGAAARLDDDLVDVTDALGRVATRRVHAAHDRPRCDLSAMDGYALASASVRGATIGGPVHLPLTADLPAGRAAPPLACGHACPISTGAPIPPGADCVLPRERAGLTRMDGVTVLRVVEPLNAGRNVRRRAEDIVAGASVLDAGERIGPEAIALLIAAGVGSVPVRPLPRLAIFSTGDELAEIGCVHAAGCEDSNGPMLSAAAKAAGLPGEFLGRARDDLFDVRRVLREALDGDAHVIVGSGGVSVGGHDHVRDAVEAEGGSVLLHGVAMRPGKPLLVARLDDRLFFGLPGNPVAAMVGFRFFVTEALRVLAGLPPERGRRVEPPISAREGLTLFLRAYRDAGRHWKVDLNQRSHVLTSTVRATHWVVMGPSAESGSVARLFSRACSPFH